MRSGAIDDLFPLVYEHLKKIAVKHASAGRSPTLHPTDLVHETYLKLAQGRAEWVDRAHFMAVAATAMRHVIVDRARRRDAEKRGAGHDQVTLTGLGADPHTVDLLDLHRVLTELEDLDPPLAQLVQLRILCGLTEAELAELLEVTDRTIRNRLRRAKAWIFARLDPGSTAAEE